MLRALIVAGLVGGVAVAAPVPKAPPTPSPKSPAAFLLGTAVVLDQKGRGPVLRFSYTRESVASSVDPAVGVPARPPRPVNTSYMLDGVKVTTADGKELTGDDLTKKLAEPVAAVRSATAFDAEWRKLFADDVLFVELVRPDGGGVVRPVPGGGANPFNPGGGVVRPLPIRPPLPPIEELPVEKPVEKKEEKK